MLKPRHSAFYGTPLEFCWRNSGIDLIIAGIAVRHVRAGDRAGRAHAQIKLRVRANCVAGFNRAQEVSALATMKRTAVRGRTRDNRSGWGYVGGTELSRSREVRKWQCGRSRSSWRWRYS